MLLIVEIAHPYKGEAPGRAVREVADAAEALKMIQDYYELTGWRVTRYQVIPGTLAEDAPWQDFTPKATAGVYTLFREIGGTHKEFLVRCHEGVFALEPLEPA
jgi:hypothetical protein